MESLEEKEQGDGTDRRDETGMTPVTPLVEDSENQMTAEEIQAEAIVEKDKEQQEVVSEPKQPTYQHTKVYQDSEGRFVIEEKIQETPSEEKGDIPHEKSSSPPAGRTTKNKEQALRYLEAFASSVAEEMKKQAAQKDEGASKQGEEIIQTNLVIPVISEKSVQECEDRSENMQMTDEDGQDEVVTVVIADATQDEKDVEDISVIEEIKSQHLGRSSSSLRRSKRKRRSKKKHYDDVDEGAEDDADGKDDKSFGEEERDVRNEGKVQKMNRKEFSEKDKSSRSRELRPKHKQSKHLFDCACGKVFPTNSQLRQHLRTHTSVKPHKCLFCGKCFRQKCQKDKHERIHTGSKPYKCRHCDRAFSESGSRNRHERIHTGYKPYQCQHCDKTFIQKGNKDAHEKIHTTFKPFKCDNENCNETFETKEEVQKHKEGHPQRPYKCHFCCKSFPFNAERKRHERCHTGVKPYKCSYCERSFTQKGNKDNHERTHTGEKPHSCPFCAKAFIRRQYLEKHQKKKHGKEAIAVTSDGNTVYAVVEVDPKLQKDGKIAAESLLTAAQIVAKHQAALENGVKTGGADAASPDQEIGQVMAKVNQQLSSVEHHVAIVDQDGMQHQVQVVQHHQISGELPQDGHITVVDGQIVEEHEVIGIQDQVVVTQQEVLDSVGTDGHVIIQHHIPSEDIHMTIVEHQIPSTEENIVVSESQQIVEQDQYEEEGQKFRIDDAEDVQEELTGEKHILVTSQGIDKDDQQKLVQEGFVDGKRVLITSQRQLVVKEPQHKTGQEQHIIVTASEPHVVARDQIEEELLIGDQQGDGETRSMIPDQSQSAEEGQEFVVQVQGEEQGQGLVIDSHQQGDQDEGMGTVIEGQDVEIS